MAKAIALTPDVLRIPALAIDGEIVIEGKVANADEIQQLLA